MAPASSHPPPCAAGCILHPGDPVRLHGLGAARALNGQEGVCERWDEAAGRMYVRLGGGEVKSLKPTNLWKVVVGRSGNAEADKVKEIFRRYDANGDGVLDSGEFEYFMRVLGLNVKCLQAFLRAVDKDGDGAIQYEEFIDWAMSTDPKSLPPLCPPAGPNPLEADAVEDDSNDAEETKNLTDEDLIKICGRLPHGWPQHGVKVVNNMRMRFPDYPVERIVLTMNQHHFHGGEVMQAIRRTGSTEVDVVPPSVVRLGKSGKHGFPALYQVRRHDEALKVYEQTGPDFSFRSLRDGSLAPVGSIRPGERFRVLEARRTKDDDVYFGRIYFGTAVDRPHWVVLGWQLNLSHTVMGGDLNFAHAERLDPA